MIRDMLPGIPALAVVSILLLACDQLPQSDRYIFINDQIGRSLVRDGWTGEISVVDSDDGNLMRRGTKERTPISKGAYR
jgi:hypothetical protein